MAKKKKILIAEDDQSISAMYKAKIESNGYEAEVAENGEEALDAARKKNPDLIILDIMLPMLDGFSVLEELKADKKTEKIPVIMLTNLGTSEDVAKGKKMGAKDYLIKAELTPSSLAEKIREYLK